MFIKVFPTQNIVYLLYVYSLYRGKYIMFPYFYRVNRFVLTSKYTNLPNIEMYILYNMSINCNVLGYRYFTL